MTWLQEVNEWLPLMGFVTPALMIVGGLVIKSKLATKEDLAALAAERIASDEAFSKRLDKLERQTEERVTAVEKACATVQADIKHLPDQDALTDVRDRISAVEGRVSAQTAAIEGLSELIKRIEHHLDLLLDHHLKADR